MSFMPRVILAVSALLATALPAAGPADSAHQLSFEQRVAAQRAIERVYYSHQVGAARPFDEAVPREVLEERVRTYLKQSVALDKFWRTPVTAEALRRELERMEANTLYPDRLQAIYQALDNDSFLIQETLIRASLASRLAKNFFASDERIHGAARAEAERLRGMLESGELPIEREDRHRTITEYSRERVGRALRTSTDIDSLQRSPLLQPEFEAEPFERELALAPERVGEIGPVTEEPGAFVIRTVVQESAGSLRVATYRVERPSWERWWQTSRPSPAEGEVRTVALRLPGKGSRIFSVRRGRGGTDPESTVPIPSVSCSAEGVWDNGILDDNPRPRLGHEMVWTGREVIVWGGSGGATGDRYDPITDTWAAISTVGAPGGYGAVVWTGREMVVWDGAQGGAYDPVSDRWRPVATTSAPGRGKGVWTGREMIVWDGERGGRYDPAGDFWRPISTGPTNRGFSVVWTGSEMILWGGYECNYDCYAVTSGARYNPETNTWANTTRINAPKPRWDHSAIWTGSSMVIWGGLIFDGDEATGSGGIYDPASDTWTSTPSAGAPAPRWGHAAVWTGREMLVWGGSWEEVGEEAARYDPAANTWSPLAVTNAPRSRSWPTAVWTGDLMVVWGGGWNDNSGGRYDPAADTWTPTFRSPGSPPAGSGGVFWTGSELIIWGWQFGSAARYNPVTDSWVQASTAGAPAVRGYEVPFWVGDSMVVWDGFARKGARYDPVADVWRDISSEGAPSSRSGSASVWTGTRFLVWGGYAGTGEVKTGAKYDPALDTWAPISSQSAPSPRQGATAVWTGEEMIIWGGIHTAGHGVFYETGGRYDPNTDTWTATSLGAAPSARVAHSAVWAGGEMIIWGGRTSQLSGVATGGRYDPVADQWRTTSMVGSASPRRGQSAFWTGVEMIVWGPSADGGRYDPVADSWTSLAEAAIGGRAAWTGEALIVWDGTRGGRYFPRNDPDSDGDGISSCEGDCDDTDPQVTPRAAELPGNSLDENCDGSRDCDPQERWGSRGAFISCVTARCADLARRGLVGRGRCKEISADARRAGFCGDGVRGESEVCDGADLGGLTCEARGFGAGTLACAPTCDRLEELGCTALCGDGVIRPPEICDGANVERETCQSQALPGGTLACNARCDGFDVSGCVRCGNERREAGESCDGSDLGGATCASLRFDGGALSCNESCEFDTSRCTSVCGDGIRRSGEACDGADPRSGRCDWFGYYRGTLTCKPDCTWDFSACEGRCGDGIREGYEQCDGADIPGTCRSLGYDDGTIGCTSRCTTDESGCTTVCGDGVRRGSETCDGADLTRPYFTQPWECRSFGLYGGVPSCKPDCTLDLSECDGRCGDGVLEGPEKCDGADIAATCQSSGYDGGTVGCTHACTLDVTGCTTICGDGVRRGLEQCDGGYPGIRTCESFGVYGGTPSCSPDCTWDLSGCDGRCGDGVREGDEECDGADISGTCASLGYDVGSIGCSSGCRLDARGCSIICGNGVRRGGELCDGEDVGSATCSRFGFSTGRMGCQADCSEYDLSGCYGFCGDGERQGVEQCDGADVGGLTCQMYGFDTGAIRCTAACKQDLSDCRFECGNGERKGPEVCDGRDMTATCGGLGFSAGVLACSSTCNGYDTSACCCWDGREGCPVCPTCGNSVREAPFEACDRLDLGGQTCESQGWGTGELVCNSRCDGFFLGRCSGPDP